MRAGRTFAAQVYGKDFCYSKITGVIREQVTMPVFGIVNDVKANALTAARYGVDTVTNGYFAVIEEGASLAELGFTSGGVDFDSKTNPRRDTPHFGGGNGAGMSVTPLTFLVISKGEVRLMNINGTGVSSKNSIVGLVSDLVDKTPTIFGKIKSFFKKNDTTDEAEDLEEAVSEIISDVKEDKE